MDDIIELNEIIVKLNDQLGIMGNNLIQLTNELDYLKIENQKLNQKIQNQNQKNQNQNQKNQNQKNQNQKNIKMGLIF